MPPRRVKVTNSHILPPYKTNVLAVKIATIMRYDTTYKRPSRAAWKRQDRTCHEQALNLHLNS